MPLAYIKGVISLPKTWNRHVKTIASAHKIAKAFKCKIVGVPRKIKLKNGQYGYRVKFQKLKVKKKKG
jgi:hypothetical protein